MRYRNERFGNDPEYLKLIHMRRRVASMLLKRRADPDRPTRKTSTCKKLCGCDWQEMRDAIEAKFYDAEDGRSMTWENYGKGPGKWCLDHIKPVCLFDWWTHKGRQEAFHWSNTQPLWYEDHLVKSKEDLALARLRKMNDPSYAQRVAKWRTLPDVLPTYDGSDSEVMAQLERMLQSS